MLERRFRAVPVGLVEGTPRLHFDVLSVGIGEQLVPDHPLARESPDPDLLAQLLVAGGEAPHAEVLVVPEGGEEVGQAAEDVVGLVGAEVVSFVEGEVPPRLGFDRPRFGPAVVVDMMRAGVDELQVAGGLDARVHPRVVGLLERRRVVPEGGGGEIRLVRGHRDLKPPGGAGQEIKDADDDRSAPVGMLSCPVIDRCRAVGRVADDAVVRLDPPAGPRTAQGDVAELHHLVPIEESLPGGLLDGRPDLAADFGKHGDADPLVLELDHRPLPLLGVVGEAVVAEVGVDAAAIGDWIRVGVGVGPEGLPILADGGAFRACQRRRRRHEGEGEEGDAEECVARRVRCARGSAGGGAPGIKARRCVHVRRRHRQST